jgi:hypothetical protein
MTAGAPPLLYKMHLAEDIKFSVVLYGRGLLGFLRFYPENIKQGFSQYFRVAQRTPGYGSGLNAVHTSVSGRRYQDRGRR